MKTPQSVRIAAALMTCALLSTAPLAMAQGFQKGADKHQRMQEQCEQMNSTDMQARHAQHQQKMMERRNETADRLKLTDEQRETWNDMQKERQQQMQKKMEKQQKRCDKMAK
jgi:Flp pilus assembly protein TadB